MKIIFIGDVSFSGQNATAPLFVNSELRDTFNSADAVICNFESTFTEEDNPGLFQSPASKASLLKEAGITHAIVANNHIYDYGYDGLTTTISELKAVGIEPLGLKRHEGVDQQVSHIKIKGVNIGLLCSGWTRVRQEPDSDNVYREYDEVEIVRILQKVRFEFDHLLVVCHRGKMFVEYPSPSDRHAFESFIREGASAVIAHHPHVVQGVSYTNDKLIAYSLGNFYFDSTEGHIQSNYSKDKQDLGLTVELSLNKQSLLGYELIPVRRTDSSGVVKLTPAESLEVLERFNKLSKKTSRRITGRLYFYWQYLRHVVPHFLHVVWHHKFKS